jgi:Zn-dependent peptidase ImmA (M78 family)
MAKPRNFLHCFAMKEFCRLRARELLAELNIKSPPVDVVEIARNCGLQVEYVDRGGGFFGQLLRERRVVEVEQNVHPHRQRFTIAHEIGHYVLEHNPIFSISDERSIDNPRKVNEIQAYTFASELLMPEPWIKKYWLELKKDPKAMALKFYVSEEAMVRRLDDAGLLGLRFR